MPISDVSILDTGFSSKWVWWMRPCPITWLQHSITMVNRTSIEKCHKIIPFHLNYVSYPDDGSVEISWASGEIDSSMIRGFSFKVTSLKPWMSLILENGVDLAVEISMPGNQIWLIIIMEYLLLNVVASVSIEKSIISLPISLCNNPLVCPIDPLPDMPDSALFIGSGGGVKLNVL